MSRILVLGGTGMLGEPAVRHLLEDGFDVCVLARNPIRIRELFGETVRVVAGDLGNIKTLGHAMEGCQAVHISVGGEVDLESAENVASLASRLDVQRVGYVSGTTVSVQNIWYPMVAAKLAAEKVIQECGVPWTVFRPTWAMGQLWNFVRSGRPMVIGNLTTPYHWFAADDMGRMVSAAYGLEAAAGRCFYIHGPEAILAKDAVERYARSLDPEAGEASVISIRKARFLALLTRNKKLRAAADLMGYFEKVDEPGDPAEANALLGAPTTTLDQWIASRGAELVKTG